jgi:hypothetical protein
MFNSPERWIFDRSNTETIVLAVIGIIVPLTFQLYIHYMLRRRTLVDKKMKSEVTELLNELGKKHASERLRTRDRPTSSN